MKLSFICAATSFLLSMTGAGATTHTINFDGQCDEYTLTSQDGAKGVWSAEAVNTGCDDGFGFGGVSKAKSLGSGNFISMGMVLFASGDSDLYTLQLQSPLVTGSAWYVFKSTDGVNFTEIKSGTYTVTSLPQARPQKEPAIFGH